MFSRVVASLALALVLAAPAQAAGVSTSGSIIRLDQGSDSFLFSNPQHTYSADGAQITLDGAAANLSQIQPGDTATLTLNDTSTGLARIAARSQPVQQFSGPFTSYSPKYRNIGASLG